jgi:hypothetical protein
VEEALVHAGVEKDGQTDLMRLVGAFGSFYSKDASKPFLPPYNGQVY